MSNPADRSEPQSEPRARAAGLQWIGWRWIGAAALSIAALVAVGPRNEFGSATPTPRDPPPRQLSELDAWLAKSEAGFNDLRPGAAKGIVWAHSDQRKTPWSVIYIHGFSADRNETAPLADQVAQALGANLYYTRLSGHGRSSDAMAEASVQDWLADAMEASTIGRQLGDKVLIIGCSTGATLATWLALPSQQPPPDAFVFISPNFGPFDGRADVVNWPWGRQLVNLLEKDYREWQPATAAERAHWTTRYPTRAVFPMMALVKTIREAELEKITTPTYVMYSERDQVISPARVREAVARFGSPEKRIEAIDYSQSPSQHVLAGAIKSPEATSRMGQSILAWLRSLPAGPTT